MTYKRFASLPRDEAIATVSTRTLNNIRVTYKILRQCNRNNWGYRISSNLFPLLTYKPANLYHGDYPDWPEISSALCDIQSLVDTQRVRISCP